VTYTHRNGETEPPTEEGWYFLTGARGVGFPAGTPLVHVAKKRYGKVCFVVDLNVPAADIAGQWWGPVTLPWKTNA
jgi:hypothetical protein